MKNQNEEIKERRFHLTNFIINQKNLFDIYVRLQPFDIRNIFQKKKIKTLLKMLTL